MKNFLNQLRQQGFKVEGDGCVIRYYYFNGKVCWTEQVHIKKWCLDEPCLIGTYDLLTGEVKAEFNPRYKFSGGHTPYKSEQECLDAQMPEVVEFGDNTPKDVDTLIINHNAKLGIIFGLCKLKSIKKLI